MDCSHQLKLFPIRLRRTEPAPHDTANCKIVGIGDDGTVYYLKRLQDGHPLVLASEWIATRLAHAINLPTCPCFAAYLPDSEELVFASQQAQDIASEAQWLSTLAQEGMLAKLAPALSQWYAFDLFTHNLDRHLGNYLFRNSPLGMALIGIDFGMALLAEGWPDTPPPIHPNSHTRRVQRQLHSRQPYPIPDADDLLIRLGNVPDAWLGDELQGVPDAWMGGTLRANLVQWWEQSRPQRLDLLRRNLADGRFL